MNTNVAHKSAVVFQRAKDSKSDVGQLAPYMCGVVNDTIVAVADVVRIVRKGLYPKHASNPDRICFYVYLYIRLRGNTEPKSLAMIIQRSCIPPPPLPPPPSY